MKILVTSSTGTVGSLLIDALVAAGERPIAGVTSDAAAAPLRARGLETRIVRFDDPTTLAQAFAGIDRLFLLFPLVEAKATFARNAVKAAREAKVPFVLRSSGGAASATSPYALMRLQAEIDDTVASSGMDFAIGRPATYMQNALTYYRDMLRSGALYLASGDGRQSFVDLRDLARAYASILRDPTAHEGARYDLTGPEALGYADIVAQVAKLSGREIKYVPVPEGAARDAMQSQGVPPWNIDMLLSLSAACRDGALAEVTSTLPELLGGPARTFAQFAADHAAAWR